MRFIPLWCTLFGVLFVSGCSLVTCPDCYEDGEQVDANAGDVFDGGPDLSEPDARSTCAMTCTTPQPYCAESTAACVACLENGHCPDGGVCRNGSCPQCTGDSDCTTPEAPVCVVSGPTVGQCVACARDGGCEGIRVSGIDLAVCDEPDGEPNICVACNGGPDECGDRVCDVRARECTEIRTASADTCLPCIASSQCPDGHFCVQEMFAGSPTGFFCLPSTSTGCDVPRLYERDIWVSIEGPDVEVCHPATTTCQGLLDDTEECVESSTCGVPGVADAICIEGTGRCTYLCGGAADCERGEGCPLRVPRICVE